ncbi:MAG: hypothetical protein RL208_305, partial [Pseudomonadota bacterium]
YSQTEFERIIHAQIRENSGNEVKNIFKDCNHMAWCTNTVPIQYQDWMVVEKIIKDNKIVNRLYLSNNKHQTPPKPQGDISEVPNVINQSQPTTTLSGLMNYNIHEK